MLFVTYGLICLSKGWQNHHPTPGWELEHLSYIFYTDLKCTGSVAGLLWPQSSSYLHRCPLLAPPSALQPLIVRLFGKMSDPKGHVSSIWEQGLVKSPSL